LAIFKQILLVAFCLYNVGGYLMPEIGSKSA